MPHFYGPVPDGPTHGKIGVIVATEPRGPLANLIYCPPDQPLFKVPRYLYDPVPSEGTGTLQCKCKQLAIGDQVEFGIDENRHNTVLWMMKSPDYLPIDCHSGGSPRMEVIAAVTTFDDDPNGLGLWNPRYKYIQATYGQLRSRPLGVPLWCCIEIVISYGQYEGATSVPLHQGFRPYYWFRLVDYLTKPVDPIEGEEVLKKAPHVTTMPKKLEDSEEKVRTEADAKSGEERPSKEAKRSPKRRHPSTTTSEETRSSTSTGSSSSSSEPRRKRRRHSHHHKRSHRHRDSKGKRREKRKHKKHGDVRRRHKKGEKATSGHRAQPENHPVAVEAQVAPQVAKVEKLHTSGPPFPYAPSAGLRVPKQEFIEQYIQPAVKERMRKAKEKRKLVASATTARREAIHSAQPPEVPKTHVTHGRSTAEGGCVAMHDKSSLDISNRTATSEAGTRTTPISYDRAVDGGEGQRKSSARAGESVSEYLSREFNVCIDDLKSVFRNQLDKVKELLIGKRVRGDPTHYPRGEVSFVVDDVTGAPPERLSAYHTPGPGPNSLAARFQQQGIKLKHPSTWPCLVQRGGQVRIKRRENARQPKDHARCYPLEVLQFDVANEEEEIGV